MKNIAISVIRARDRNCALTDRHEAFSELVVRFQDMAFAYCFAVLGDSYMAEDVAQEAFITAWHRLSQLKDPEAFPGWFKRIVQTQCNRLLRTKRLQFTSTESAINKKLDEDSLALSTERHELVGKVLDAIKELPEKQRLVTLLFYVNGYTQSDICRFLEVPVSTVNKRLYMAREKLREAMVAIVKSDLEQNRPSRSLNFTNRVNTRLRPITGDDWDSITRLAFGRRPDDLPGNQLWLARRQTFAESKYLRKQYVAEEHKTKRIVAYGAIEQTVYLPRYRLLLVTAPKRIRTGVGDLIVDQLVEDLRKANAIVVSCQEHSSDTELISFLKQKGFEEVTKEFDLRLDLEQAQTNSLPENLAAINRSGIMISNLTKERLSDPNYAEKLHQLSVLLQQDSAKLAFKPPSYNAREARLWLEMPYVLPDGLFIAKHNDQYVGVIEVSLRACLPQGVTLNYGGVLPKYRRRGIGRTLLLQAIAFAKANGYSVMRSLNDVSANVLIQLNRSVGFETETELVTLERCLREVAPIDVALFDEYAGTYRAESGRPSPLDLLVRNENGRLTGECIGQKVELFPKTQVEFFIKQFYGEITFVRDAFGRVGHLTFVQTECDRSDKFEAIRVSNIPTN